MADRYWVGGTDNWNNTAGAKWSATSGGAGGETVPTAADDVYIDANSGASTVTLTQDGVCRNLTFTSGSGDFAGTFSFQANITISGEITLVAGMTFNPNNTMTFNATTTGNKITSAGKTLPTLVFNGAGGGWELQDNAASVGLLSLTSGSIDLNNFSFSAPGFLSSNSNARSIAFGSNGSLVLTGTNGFNTQNVNNLTYTGSCNVYVQNNSASALTIATGGPAEANTLNFYITTGTYTLTEVNNFYRTLDFTGFSGTLPNNTRRIYGNLVLSPTMTLSAGTNATTFISSSATPQTITTNGKTADFPLIVSAPGGTYRLIDDLTIGSTRTLTLTRGTFDANGNNVNIGSFALGSGTKTLTIGSGTWTIAGTSWNANTNVTNLTVSASTGTINMTSSSAKTFAGGGKAWPTLNQGGSGALTIQQANTFADITNTVQPATITFPASTTTTVSDFSVSGTSGNLITLNSSTPGTQATLSDASGINSVSFCDIEDINATGGATWNAWITSGNLDGGNNTGWDFLVQVGRYIYTRRKNKVILQS